MTDLNTGDLSAAFAPTLADLMTLYNLQLELARVKASEAMLRKRIAAHFFPNPTEGSAHNKYPLATLGDTTGAILQMDHKINRKVLEPELAAYKAAEDAGSNEHIKLPWNKLIKWKPELSGTEYKKLTAEERAACDTVLEIKDGMPDLKVVIPKRGS
jgi:hypothetical protein